MCCCGRSDVSCGAVFGRHVLGFGRGIGDTQVDLEGFGIQGLLGCSSSITRKLKMSFSIWTSD